MPRTESSNSAADYIPEQAALRTLREAVQKCRGCDLYAHATQAVFGEGPKSADIVLIGEQPGDEEDRQGHPFVGPSGKLLDRALVDAGIDRSLLYVTNAVKHFKFEERGKRRLHKKPNGIEIRACQPWLEAEINLLQPQNHRVPGRHCRADHLRQHLSLDERTRTVRPKCLGTLCDVDRASLGCAARAGRRATAYRI